MQNWTCTTCNTLNSSHQEICGNCGNAPTTQPPSQSTRKNWERLLQICRILGVLGAIAIIIGLFLPWVIHYAPDGSMTVYAGYMFVYGLITAVFGLILLFLMAKENLAKKWYVLAIILAVITYYVASMPAQISEVYNRVSNALGGSAAEVPASIAGIGVSVIHVAVILVIIAAIPHFFRQASTNLADD